MDKQLKAMQRFWGEGFRWWKTFLGLLIFWFWGLLALAGDEEPSRTLFGFAPMYLGGFIGITFRAWLNEIFPVSHDPALRVHRLSAWKDWRNYLAFSAFLIVMALGVLIEPVVMDASGWGVGPR